MYKQINQGQRYQVAALLKAGLSKASIALQLGVHGGSIYRELNRNEYKDNYNALQAQEFTDDRKQHTRGYRTFTSSMKLLVREKLKLYWSPQQIVGRCKKEGISIVSHERIYQYIGADKVSGGLLYTLRNTNNYYLLISNIPKGVMIL